MRFWQKAFNKEQLKRKGMEIRFYLNIYEIFIKIKAYAENDRDI